MRLWPGTAPKRGTKSKELGAGRKVRPWHRAKPLYSNAIQKERAKSVNRLTTEKRAQVLSCLVEGMSINATARLCGCSKVTILRLLADAGTLCAQFHDLYVRNLHPARIQMDEIWAFCGCKDLAKRRGAEGEGSVWTWTAIDADSKLVLSYLVGQRDPDTARAFVCDVADRIDTRVQITTDGLSAYIAAVRAAFGVNVDFARLYKVYGKEVGPEWRYSPPKVVETRVEIRTGRPETKHISTSYVERQNLTIRMGSRRFTRLTNAFSKKFENHCHAVALHFFHYNFIRKHQTLKTTPAVAAGVADRAWTVLDLVREIELEESRLGSRITEYLPAR